MVCGKIVVGGDIVSQRLEEMVNKIAELEQENTYLAEENIELARENRELRTIVGYHLTSNRSV